MRIEVSGVPSSCDRVAIRFSRRALLIADVGDVLKPEEKTGWGAVARVKRRRPEHVGVLSPAKKERDLEWLPLSRRMSEHVANCLAEPEIVWMLRAQVRESRPE